MLLIATASSQALERLKAGLQSAAPFIETSDAESMRQAVRGQPPEVILLDIELAGLSGVQGVAEVQRWCPRSRIISFGSPISDDLEFALIRAGARGYLAADMAPHMVGRAIKAVCADELWIRRSIVPRMLAELVGLRNSRTPSPAPSAPLSSLTDREIEIAARIGASDSNKQIARQLAITERTVKAHLTGIFRKLGLRDRVGLALLVSGRRNS